MLLEGCLVLPGAATQCVIQVQPYCKYGVSIQKERRTGVQEGGGGGETLEAYTLLKLFILKKQVNVILVNKVKEVRSLRLT